MRGCRRSRSSAAVGQPTFIFRLVWAKKPRRALVTAPTFAEYATALKSVGCTVERFFLREQEDFAVTDAFCAAIRPGVDMVFLCQPNNPTGQLTALPLVEQILHAARRAAPCWWWTNASSISCPTMPCTRQKVCWGREIWSF